VQGVHAARAALDEAGLGRAVHVGFSATPTFGPAARFWDDVGRLGGRAFAQALDYVALDFFPDVFRPAAPDGQPGDVAAATSTLLHALRGEWMPAAGLPPRVAIHVGENGWPTGTERPYGRQAAVLERVVRAVHAERDACNVARYTLFSLRDA